MNKKSLKKPSRAEAEEAVRTLIRWAGDNPDREGLKGTPDRVVRSYEEFFDGYSKSPEAILKKTFEEINEYNEMVVLNNIPFESFCEHHILPIIGKVHIGYIPSKRVIGISKLARIVDVFAKRLQIQEKMTSEIAEVIDKTLKPKGVGVVVEATHQCMTTRGVHKRDVVMKTSHLTGLFLRDQRTRKEFFNLVSNG